MSGPLVLPDPPSTFAARGALAKWLRVNEESLVFADRPDVFDYLAVEERAQLTGLGAVASIPLISRGRLLALVVLAADRAPWKTTPAFVRLLEACGRQAALVLESVTLHYQERLRLESASRAQQLAVAGQLAAAVAHEVRNPLTTIRSSVQYVIDSTAEWPSKTDVLRQVMGEVDRINRTVSGVLGLSRPQELALADLDLADLVDGSLRLFQPYFDHHRLTLARGPRSTPLPVRGDAGQLRQVFLNVLLNACQATPDGGRLTVSCDVRAEPASRSEAVVVIGDTGHGIPADHRARIFEPFFTTKAGGTGLGLSICRDIMTRHHGGIRLDSQPGDGTTVHLTLPLRDA